MTTAFARRRGFEIIDENYWTIPPEVLEETGVEIKLPKRATQQSAAYDFFALNDAVILPGQSVYFPTHIKAYMQPGEVLLMYPRSSQGIKLSLMLSNTTGVVDADYYSNPENDGHIGIYLRNVGSTAAIIKAGDRIAQGMFTEYLMVDGEEYVELPKRVGGTGSTGR
ncbi:Deoxyuridine 5'-triphosphate nucleotidohydrolase [compost metagenome]